MVAPLADEELPADSYLRKGARALQRRWFQGSGRARLATLAAPGPGTLDLDRQLEELDRLLRRMPEADRERVLDLARRLSSSAC